MKHPPYVLLVSGALGGLHLYGPFRSREAARAFQDERNLHPAWPIQLEPPTPAAVPSVPSVPSAPEE